MSLAARLMEVSKGSVECCWIAELNCSHSDVIGPIYHSCRRVPRINRVSLRERIGGPPHVLNLIALHGPTRFHPLRCFFGTGEESHKMYALLSARSNTIDSHVLVATQW